MRLFEYQTEQLITFHDLINNSINIEDILVKSTFPYKLDLLKLNFNRHKLPLKYFCLCSVVNSNSENQSEKEIIFSIYQRRVKLNEVIWWFLPPE